MSVAPARFFSPTLLLIGTFAAWANAKDTAEVTITANGGAADPMVVQLQGEVRALTSLVLYT